MAVAEHVAGRRLFRGELALLAIGTGLVVASVRALWEWAGTLDRADQ